MARSVGVNPRYPRLWTLALVVALVAAACGSDTVGDTQAPQGTTAGPTTAAPQPSPDEPVEIVFWWWGDDEAPGLRGWIEETVQKFEEQNPNMRVEAVEQTTDGLIPAAQAAQAAQQGPDIQFYWPTGWFQEDMFNGGLAPLDELLADEVPHYFQAYRDYATWDGHVYGAPFYSIGNPWVYRKDLFEQAGLDPNQPPVTYEDFIEAGEKLLAADITPIAAGINDQWYADWPWMLFQACGLDSTSEWFDAYLGETPGGLTAQPYLQTWEKIADVIDRGFYLVNVGDLTLYEGFDRLLAGEAAIATPIAPTAIQWGRALGSDKLGVMLTPCQDQGKLSSAYPDGSQYLGIPSFSEHKEEAATFIAFMHTPERMQALFEQSGAIMGDDRLTIETEDPIARQLLDWSGANSYFAVYYLAPPNITEWTWPNVGQLFTGDITPEEAAEIADSTNRRYIEDNPEFASQLGIWRQFVEN